jgi:hypothetical protein
VRFGGVAGYPRGRSASSRTYWRASLRRCRRRRLRSVLVMGRAPSNGRPVGFVASFVASGGFVAGGIVTGFVMGVANLASLICLRSS